MKKLVCFLLALLIVLSLAGCSCSAGGQAVEESVRELANATGKSESDFSPSKSTDRSSLCEGEQVAVAMMLSDAGYNPDLNSYDRLWLVEIVDDEGEEYRVLFTGTGVVIPDRYLN